MWPAPNRLVKQTIHAMKKAIILGSVFSVLALMLVSCASEPEATTTTTRQTTVTTPVAPPSQTTTTTTHRMGGGY
jgi:starvation-inducible outer membrane lipoprotein